MAIPVPTAAQEPAPYVSPHWTMTAALLWIATRDLDAALEGNRFNRLRDAFFLWVAHKARLSPNNTEKAAENGTARGGAINLARSQVMTACERSDLVALGLRTTFQPKAGQRGLIDLADTAQTDSSHAPIPATDWSIARHMLCDHGGRAELRVRIKGGPGRLGRLVAWREILLPSADVMRLWPPTSKDHKCRRWLADRVQTGERITKAAATAHAVQTYGVSANHFQESIWPDIAPDEWRKAGRPRGRKSGGKNRRAK